MSLTNSYVANFLNNIVAWLPRSRKIILKMKHSQVREKSENFISVRAGKFRKNDYGADYCSVAITLCTEAF